MSDIFQVTQFKCDVITNDAKKFYDLYVAQIPTPPQGATVSPSPVMIGYKLSEDILSIKIGTHRFDIKQNQHLYLETILDRKLTQEELNILTNFKSKQGIEYLVEFSKAAWDRMDESFEGHVIDTVFQGSTFAGFDEKMVIKTINNLQKL